MSTAACLPAPITLHRPWWVRWIAAVHESAERRLQRDAEREVYGALSHLDEGTLRDIGAPESMHAEGRGLELWRLERASW
jgi:hypothetical protein